MKPPKSVRDYLAELGRRGRSVNSGAQQAAARENGKKGGRPKKKAKR